MVTLNTQPVTGSSSQKISPEDCHTDQVLSLTQLKRGALCLNQANTASVMLSFSHNSISSLAAATAFIGRAELKSFSRMSIHMQ